MLSVTFLTLTAAAGSATSQPPHLHFSHLADALKGTGKQWELRVLHTCNYSKENSQFSHLTGAPI